MNCSLEGVQTNTRNPPIFLAYCFSMRVASPPIRAGFLGKITFISKYGY